MGCDGRRIRGENHLAIRTEDPPLSFYSINHHTARISLTSREGFQLRPIHHRQRPRGDVDIADVAYACGFHFAKGTTTRPIKGDGFAGVNRYAAYISLTTDSRL